jgi:hypothetical protein
VAIGLGLDYHDRVELRVSAADHTVDLVLGGSVAEIRLRRNHLEVLRDQLPGVLSRLGVLDAARDRAGDAGSRARRLEASLGEAAAAIVDTGRAGLLRDTAEQLNSTAQMLADLLAGMYEAAAEADTVCDLAERLLAEQTVTAQRRGEA